MPQNSQPSPLPFMRTLDQARHIQCHQHSVPFVRHAEPRLQCCERVVRDFRLRPGYHAEQRRFPGVRRTQQRHVGEQLNLELDYPFLARLSSKRDKRLLVRRTREVYVPKATPTSVRNHRLNSVRRQLRQQARLFLSHLPDHGSHGHVDVGASPSSANALLASPSSPTVPNDSVHSLQMPQCPYICSCPADQCSAISTISPVRAPARTELLTEE